MNQKYSPEMREKALRMLDEAKPSHPNLMTAVRHVAGLLGMSAETLRVWHRRREVDGGQRPGVPPMLPRRTSACGVRTLSCARRTKSSKPRACFSRRNSTAPDRSAPRTPLPLSR